MLHSISVFVDWMYFFVNFVSVLDIFIVLMLFGFVSLAELTIELWIEFCALCERQLGINSNFRHLPGIGNTHLPTNEQLNS